MEPREKVILEGSEVIYLWIKDIEFYPELP
jgi:hypothetical protein